jgi:hypothetical protein
MRWPHFWQGGPSPVAGEELNRNLSTNVPVPISCPAALVKWITMPSPAYIPEIGR